MTTEIQIINGVARLTETKVVGEMPLSELAPYLEYRKPVTLPILPDNVTFVAFDEQNSRGVLLVERPPTVTGLSCHFDPGNRFPKKDQETAAKGGDPAWHTFEIAVPWQYHLYGFTINQPGIGTAGFRIDETGYFWGRKQMQSLDDEIVAAALLNINKQANICWGSTQAPTDSLKNRINGQVKNFLGTHFNTHYGWFHPPAYKSYTEYEEASKKNPRCWDTPEWDEYWNAKSTVGGSFRRIKPRELAATFDPEAHTRPATNVTEWGIPDPPPVFTVARAIAWFDRMDEDDKRRFAYALSQVKASLPPETPEQEAPGMARVNG